MEVGFFFGVKTGVLNIIYRSLVFKGLRKSTKERDRKGEEGKETHRPSVLS
jgi:hypothetical protein